MRLSLLRTASQFAHLADDSNEFDEAWLEEQQRRLDAVYS
jgi:hypothetical protein